MLSIRNHSIAAVAAIFVAFFCVTSATSVGLPLSAAVASVR